MTRTTCKTDASDELHVAMRKALAAFEKVDEAWTAYKRTVVGYSEASEYLNKIIAIVNAEREEK